MKYFYSFILFHLLYSIGLQAQDSPIAKCIFTSPEKNSITARQWYYYRPEAQDSSGQQIMYGIHYLPQELHFNASDHSISGRISKIGHYSISIFATNGQDTATQQFILTVSNSQTSRILCIGNSITNGTGRYNSYRRALWQLLHKGRYNFDMIGSWSKHHMGAEMPNPDFDMDHEGHSGWTAADIFNPPSWDSTRGNITQWLHLYTPDVVLIELGTNDVFQCRKTADILNNLVQLVQVLRNKNPDVKICISQVPPLGRQWAGKKLCGNNGTYDAAIRELNAAIIKSIPALFNPKSPILVVDQFTGIIPAKDMYDDIHPNEQGEEKMARTWFNAIKPYISRM